MLEVVVLDRSLIAIYHGLNGKTNVRRITLFVGLKVKLIHDVLRIFEMLKWLLLPQKRGSQ